MTKVLIYGSCVTRDIVRLHETRFQHTYYIARQSLVSAFTEPAGEAPTPNLNSAFMRRNLIGDFMSDAPELIAKHLPESDLFLIDFVSDKRGVYPLKEGGYVSFTQELGRSKLLAEYPHSPRILFGSDQHFAMWQTAAESLKALLMKHAGFDRTVIVAAPFTDASADGQPVAPFHGMTASELNRKYDRYYDHLEALGFHVLRMPEDLAVADPNHQWGIAHDHYIDSAYAWLADELEAFATAHRTAVT